MKKITAGLIIGLTVAGSVSMAFASSLKTRADIAAEVTGKTLEQITAEREAGKPYGVIASEAGVFDAFKAEVEKNDPGAMANCDGTGENGSCSGRGRNGGCGGMGRGLGMRGGNIIE
ncbi:MAG: hypothetical protein K0S71_2118 [Clostridia bacterium]|jgi:hypothetical protein|nr:hypothetical protein [Clostridia bacterium]